MFRNLFKKDIQVLMVTGEKVEKIYSIFRMRFIQMLIVLLLSVCIAFYFILGNFVMVQRQNLLQMDFEALNNHLNSDKAELVYNYIQENDLSNYAQLEEIDGIGPKTVKKLEKYTYIKEVD